MKKRTLQHSTAVLASVAVLALGASDAAAQKVGEKFGDWTFQCAAVEANKTQCALMQELMLKVKDQPRRRLLRASLTPIANGFLLETLLPLGIDIPQGTTVKVDKGKPTRMTLQRCVTGGCLGTMKLTGSMLTAFKKGLKLEVIFFASSPGGIKPVKVPVSLKGVSEGLALLK
jgi:invasion protein IalB